jgi:hypothetical protein
MSIINIAGMPKNKNIPITEAMVFFFLLTGDP